MSGTTALASSGPRARPPRARGEGVGSAPGAPAEGGPRPADHAPVGGRPADLPPVGAPPHAHAPRPDAVDASAAGPGAGASAPDPRGRSEPGATASEAAAAAARAGDVAQAFQRTAAVVRRLVGLTLGSRALGFGRDVLMATTLGTGAVADAFFLAWLLPNLARRVFGEGAFANALVPELVAARDADLAAAQASSPRAPGDAQRGAADGQAASSLAEPGGQEAPRLLGAALCRLGALLVALVLVLEVLCAAAASGPGQAALAGALGAAGAARLSDVLPLAALLLPLLAFSCLQGVLGGALNALDRYGLPAAAPAALNAAWIAALLAGLRWLDAPLERARLLAGVLAACGGVLLLVHLRAVRRAGLPVAPRWRADPARLARVRGVFLGVALGAGLYQVNALLDGLIAWGLVAEGGVSALFYANRLVQLPIGVLGVALATAALPALARRLQAGDAAGAGALLDRGLALAWFVALPAAVGLAALAGPLVAALFERGAFDAASSARTARVVLCLAPAVVASCVTPVLARWCYAEQDATGPARIGAACVVLNLVLNLAWVGPLGEAGLALATSCSQTASLLAHGVLVARRRRARGDRLDLGLLGGAFARTGALAAAMSAAAVAAAALAPGGALGAAALGVLAGVVVFAGGAAALRAPELRALVVRRAGG